MSESLRKTLILKTNLFITTYFIQEELKTAITSDGTPMFSKLGQQYKRAEFGKKKFCSRLISEDSLAVKE